MIKQPQRRATSTRNVLSFSFAAVVVLAWPSCNDAATTTPAQQHRRDFFVDPGGLRQHDPTDHLPLLFLRGGGGRRNRILDYYSSCTTVWDANTNSYICQPNNNKIKSLPIIVPVLFVGLAILIAWCIKAQKQQQQQLDHRQHQPSNNNTNSNSTDAQPRLVTAAAVFQRSSPNARAGIGFVGKDYAKITRIQHDSVFHGSDLVPGMKVVSINNISIGSARQAAEIIAAAMAMQDAVTILAHSPGYYGSTENFVTATAVKEQPDQPLGITYKKEFTHGPIRLGTISETSLLLQSSQSTAPSTTSGSDFAAGMEVVAVNNVSVQSLAQATEITRSAFPLVTILARRSAAVVVAVMESSISGDSSVSIVAARPISQSYAIGDEPLAVATAAATTTMIVEEDSGSSIEL